MKKAAPYLLAALLTAIGGALGATPFLRDGLPTAAIVGAAIGGQLCWLAAGLIFLTKASGFAGERFSYDGPWIVVFSSAKWAVTTVLILADAMLMERAWEVMFILPR